VKELSLDHTEHLSTSMKPRELLGSRTSFKQED